MKHTLTAVLLIILCLPAASFASSNEDCLACHGKEGSKGYVDPVIYGASVHQAIRCSGCHIDVTAYPHRTEIIKVQCGICHLLGREGAPTAQARQYQLSVHGKAAQAGMSEAPRCQTCHGSHYIFDSKNERSTTSRMKIPALCSQCHPAEFTAYAGSIHGKELLEKNNLAAATCFDCHMEHRISNVNEPQWKLALINECGSCHSTEMDTYKKTYHGKVTKLGYSTVAKCSDCHGSHNILPVFYKESMIATENIQATCKNCHKNATASFAKFYAHPEESNRAKYPILYYTYKFMTLLLIGVFTFFLTHTILWAYRALREKMQSGKGGK
ncbi:MAG: hypothetical protein HQL08_11110 [Nitrospirae bacterium]|nr:hypothetical protein [Nitrospirota bacterium]